MIVQSSTLHIYCLLQMSKFLDSREKKDCENEKGRAKQIAEQLPVHDFDDSYCDNLTDLEKEKMQDFSSKRAEEAAGQGEIIEKSNEETPYWVRLNPLLDYFAN